MTADAFDLGGATHVGRRTHNEDAYLIDRDRSLIIVADGVGGHAAGEVASQLACEVLQQHWLENGDLEAAVSHANLAVATAAAEKNTQGMGTTVVAVAESGGALDLTWVGDSRAYLYNGDLHLLTRDHSLVEARIAMGEIRPEDADTEEAKNVILQALGLVSREKLEVGRNRIALKSGERLLVCTDGLSGVVSNTALVEILSAGESAQITADKLVQKAVELGGSDNVTVALVDAAQTMAPTAPVEPTLVWSYHSASDSVEYFQSKPKIRRIKPRNQPEAAAPSVPNPDSQQHQTGTAKSGAVYLWLMFGLYFTLFLLLLVTSLFKG